MSFFTNLISIISLLVPEALMLLSVMESLTLPRIKKKYFGKYLACLSPEGEWLLRTSLLKRNFPKTLLATQHYGPRVSVAPASRILIATRLKIQELRFWL